MIPSLHFLEVVTHPENGEVEDDDGHEAYYIHPGLIAADEARVLCEVAG